MLARTVAAGGALQVLGTEIAERLDAHEQLLRFDGVLLHMNSFCAYGAVSFDWLVQRPPATFTSCSGVTSRNFSTVTNSFFDSVVSFFICASR